MRLFKSLLVGMTAFLVAGSAAATVTINNATTGSTSLTAGQTIAITVRLKWDGQGALQGIFASTGYDSSVLEFVSATSAPGSVLNFVTTDENGDPLVIPGLNRLLQPSIVNGALRTVQYGAGSAESFVDPGAANAGGNGTLITTLTFRAIGVGTTNVSAIIAQGDGIAGDVLGAGTSVSVTVVPEPGTALLMGLGLAGLGLAGRRS